MTNISVNERVAILEEQNRAMAREITEINGKLDSILELKNKGAGAFWLASTLFGAVLALGWSVVMDFVRG